MRFKKFFIFIIWESGLSPNLPPTRKGEKRKLKKLSRNNKQFLNFLQNGDN